MDLPSLGVIAAVVAIIVGIVGLWRGWWESPTKRTERERAAEDRVLNQAMGIALLGVKEVKDLGGGQLVKPVPGLVDRVSTMEQTLVEFRHMVGLWTESQKRIDIHDVRFVESDARHAQHEAALAALIASTFDSGAQAALAAEQLKRKDTIDGETDS